MEKELRQKYMDNTYLLGKDLLGFKDMTVDFHYDKLCKKLMEPREKLIRLWLVPRGFLKTTTLTITDSISLQLRNPSIRIAVISAVLANAKSMVTAIGMPYLTNSRFRMLFPEFCPKKPLAPETKWTSTEIEIPGRYKDGGHPVMESTFEAFGADSTLTSRHFDYIKCDDLVTRENSTSKEQMEKIKDFYRAIFPLRNSPSTPMDIIGTRWDDNDLYGELETDEDIEVIKFSAGLNTGIPLWPIRYPLSELRKIKAGPKMGAYLYSCLYEMEPIPEEEAIFKQRYFKHFTIHPSRTHLTRDDGIQVPIGNCYMTIDGATEEGKNDYSAMVIAMMDNQDNIYFLETYNKQIDPALFIDELFDLYEKWNCIKFAGQKALVEKMLWSFIKKKMRVEKRYVSFEPLGKNTMLNKEYTIKQLQPWYEGGYVWHNITDKDGVMENSFIRFPRGKNDDLPDAAQMQLEILKPSTQPKTITSYDRNSLELWKRRLRKAFGTSNFNDASELLIGARTY